ncbi:hypothetical protein B0J14DRAFT_215703 [Halenospora varia]|nr:hypothetical protein B0J14DRAFT_215703 [Halenospora varia]
MASPPVINVERSTDYYDDPAWNERSDVLYHFYAFHYFAPTSSALDLINLTDADVEFYDRAAHMTLGMSHQYKLATYLESHHDSAKTKITSALTSPATPIREKSSTSTESSTEQAFRAATASSTITNGKVNSYRLEFLAHVQEYNINVVPRKRFYLLGLTPSDTTLLSQLATSNPAFAKIKGKATKLRTASDGLPDSGEKMDNPHGPEEEERGMREKIDKCIGEYRAKVYGSHLAVETDLIKEKAGRMSLVLGGIV